MKCVVAGSFDPITNGHVWLIQQACKMFDEVLVVVGINPTKKYRFTTAQRCTLVHSSLGETLTPDDLSKITIHVNDGLLIQFAADHQADVIVRGIRNTEDFNYEHQMQLINREICSNIETVFLIPPAALAAVSSSTVKGLVGFDNWQDIVRKYVCNCVVAALGDTI